MKRTVFITDGMVELLIPQVPLMGGNKFNL